MKIVQSTWVRYHHIDLARELQQLGNLERVFTSLPWWKAAKEAREHNIPREKISCSFLFQGIRHVGSRFPNVYPQHVDHQLEIIQTKLYSRWVAKHLPECDAFIGLSGSGLDAGRVAKKRGAGYIMDRGSAHLRWAVLENQREAKRWKIPYTPNPEWLIENEENEQEEANLITVPSNFAAGTFIDMGVNPSKIRVVPYGVETLEFSPCGRPKSDEFKVVFVGGARMLKGIGYLLEAFENFDHPNKRLVFVGAVDDSIKPLFRLFSSKGIEFIGSIPRREVKFHLSTAHCLALPSIHEGLAMVIAQAMACGCPVIASDSTGFDEIAISGTHGFMVPSRNPQALTSAFVQLADEPDLREEMSSACLQRVREMDGWKTYAKNMVEVAKEAVDINASRSQSIELKIY